MSSSTMKRWELTRYGRDGLRVVREPVPTAGHGEVLTRVGAVSLNYRDTMVVEHGMGGLLPLPATPGADLAGEIVALGPGATRFQAGDRVIANFTGPWIDGTAPHQDARAPLPTLSGVLPGVLAEYTAMPDTWLVPAPASLDDEQASTLPIAGLTAWYALVELGGLRAGQTILTQGTGGVSLFAVQFAAAHGARVIITSSSDEKIVRAKALGASDGINRLKTPAWGEAALELTGGRGVDHLLEIAGGDLTQSTTAVARGGRITLIDLLEGFEIKAPVYSFFQKQLVLEGVMVGHRRALEDMVRAIDRLGLKPVIDGRYAFDDLPSALDHLKRGSFGKIVVRVAS